MRLQMRTDHRSHSNVGIFPLLVAIALILNACSNDRPLPTEETPTFPSRGTLGTPPYVGTPRSTTLSKPAATIVSGLTPTSEVKLKVFEIESGYTDHQVVKAFWSYERNSIYYAFAPAIGDRPLNWASYDVTTHVKTNTASPLKFDSKVWQRLNTPDPTDNLALYPELSGYVAPSGTHVIFTIDRGDQFAVPSNPNPVTELWIANLTTGSKTKLLELPPGIISQAVWFEHESKVIFDFGSEGGVHLYIADVQNTVATPLADMSDFKSGTEQHWDVSPDGITLAVIDLQGMLWLVSLENGRLTAVDRFSRNPAWSMDGKYLFYWWGSVYDDTHILRSYEVATGNVSTVIDQSSLVNLFNGLRPNDFAVSADRSKIMFWGGGLWLVELQK